MEKEYDNYLHLFNKRDSVFFNILAAHPNHALVKTTNLFPTLIERKSRMRQIRGVKGEAVVVYCKPLTTKEMAYHRLSRRVNKIEIK